MTPVVLDPLTGAIDQALNLSTLTVGDHVLNIVGTDLAGNLGVTVVFVSLDALPPLSLAAATAVHRDGDAWLDALREHIDHNLRLVGETVASRLPNARFEMPEATYLAWIDFGPHADGIDDLSGFFAREAHVLLEGPHKFVADADRCVRLNVACPTPKVVEALDRMIGALEQRAADAA